MLFTFKDYYKVAQPSKGDVNIDWKDFSTDSTKRALRVKMKATHAGLINENNKFYIPSRMADGAKTFIKDNGKHTKVLKHHDPTSDPVGIVHGAQFIPTVPEDLQTSTEIATLFSPTAAIKDQLKAFRDLYVSGVLTKEGYEGLGYIEILADILDRESIEQIYDQRFDAVSTNFGSPDQVYCSVCDNNLAQNGYCDHFSMFSFGELYPIDEEDKDSPKVPAIPIPGIHNYKEVSLVSLEGDKLATVEIVDEINKENNKVVFMPDNWQPKTDNDTVFQFKDFKEGVMATPKNNPLTDKEKAVFDVIKKHRDSLGEDKVIELAKEIAEAFGKDGYLPNQQEAELDEDTAILYILEDKETVDQEIDEDAICDEMQKELQLMKDEGILSEDEFTAADAKLSTAARKKLSGSTFCGPKRSFPVPDCAHVTAAKRLIGRYKGPGSKSSILACVNRKAKALGCEKGSKDNLDPKPSTACQEPTIKNMSDGEVRNMFHSAEMELISRKLAVKRECSDCATWEARFKEAEENVLPLQEEVAKLKNTLDVLRSELRSSYADYEGQVNQYIQLGLELHAVRLDNLALIGVLNNRFDSIDAAKEEISKSNIDKQAAVITDGFDLQKIMDKLNDGMANTPKGTVEDPTINIDKDNPMVLDTKLSDTGKAALENVRKFIDGGNLQHAKLLFDKMKAMEVFPDELKWETFTVVDDK